MTLADIYKPVAGDLQEVERMLLSIAEKENPLLSELLQYVVKNGGKRIRPAFTLFSAKFHDYNLEKLVPTSAGLELLHTATLVHDDIVDNSELRRGKPSVAYLYGINSALLLGDYLFAKAASLVASTGNLRVIRLFAYTLMTISSGELAQIKVLFDQKRAREHYYTWVSAKTACLFTTATESGAVLSNAPEEEITALKEYGYNFGMAFQVVDDVLDFNGKEEELGKPVGSDLMEGAVTLPIILYSEKYPDDDIIRKVIEKEDKEQVALVIQKIINSPIIDECLAIANDFSQKAMKSIEKLSNNSSKDSLMEMATIMMKRKK
jgi:heptaprenyl diphosphate synthase